MFGALLRHYRELAELSQEALGLRIGFSKSQVAMVERGHRPPKGDFVPKADSATGASGALIAAALKLKFSHLASWFAPFADEEAKCVARYEYESSTVPGLLQTEAHAYALHRAACPPLDDDEIDRLVAGRLARQALLTRRPLVDVSFVLEMSALTRPIGGRKVHRAQLQHLLDISELRNVSIQVMSPHRETHVGLNGPFVLLETVDRRRLAYLEVQGQNFLVSEQPQLGILFSTYGMLRTHAHGLEESRELIKQTAKDYEH
ncbi:MULTISPECIES: helix-turn-helix transcriptional regulator [unclassified Streptomyces]|uniref:helix-turn-helix domain-containing protein n=1 Tax=unclassified Streptomyces TaxID=2593676 RepID=UPI000370E030|nr:MULTISPECIES: helix-turn-helix transcriptional regulator [unclassified Streptomyces]MYQ78368.1 helix-turn-helix domain-containing protein [Streptomyces sp. SID4923]NEC10585.1 helix-turn-helix domain-containing protein [Streptomyces sp. SID7909]